jgi:hypothetical protein
MNPHCEVKPLARESIDAWPIRDAGLPIRAVRRLAQRGTDTMGGLRELDATALSGLRGMGAVTLRSLDTFFARCDTLEAGRPLCTSLDEVFKTFLTRPQHDVLVMRYSLRAGAPPTMPPGEPVLTLQAVGTHNGLTRERIRQVEARARAALSSRLAEAALAPFYAPLDALLRARGGAADADDVDRAADPAFCAGYFPARVLGVLGPLRRSPVTFAGIFTAVPPALLARLKTDTIAFLRRAGGSQPLEAVSTALAPWLAAAAPCADARAIPHLLENLAAVCVTRDGLYFLEKRGAQPLLLSVMQTIGKPAHYRVIQDAFNARMRPGSRMGKGTLLTLLRRTPGIVPFGNGFYRLAPAGAPSPAAAEGPVS